MPHVAIEWLEDTHECDTCGTSYALGAVVKIDGQEVLDLTPAAHCYDGTNYEYTDIYKAILNHIGYTIEESSGA